MRIPTRLAMPHIFPANLKPRTPADGATGDDETSDGKSKPLIIAVVFIAVVSSLLIVYLVLRHCRKRHKEPPKYFPEFLRRQWRKWTPGAFIPVRNASLPPNSLVSSTRRRRGREPNPGAVDRTNSTRSIMTLPEYRPVALADRERTIGREGERAGIDVVIEFPETEEEEEGRREEHMNSLYEIRLARRLEQATARESGDLETQLAAEAANGSSRPNSGQSRRGSGGERRGSGNNMSSLLQALQNIQERDRRTSQVSYSEVGVARHDGSRLRPSCDSDRPLIEGANPMGTSSIRSVHSRSGSVLTNGSATPERRDSSEILLGRPSLNIDAPAASPRGSFTSVHSIASPMYSPNPNVDPGTPGWGVPAEYEGEDWGPPPDYTSPIATKNDGPDHLPVLRIDTGTPSASSVPSPAHSTRSSVR